MSAPMWKTAVDEFMKGENDSGSNIVARELSNGDLKLLELVENLGDYLISVDNTARSRGTKLLADVLHQLVDDQLSEKEVELLVVYFCDRLKDHHSVQPPALLGLLALSRMKNLPDGCSQKICRGIFQEVQNQSLSQIDRRSVYTIISTLLSTKLKELLEIGTNFVYGFIQAMDAEKDPRNLVIAFNCAKIIIQNFPLGVFVEEMFEVVSCYFPIDFTPPPADVNAISRDDLILGLRGCLAASPKFGPHCYPLLLEKMTSDIPSAKLDSLKTLDVCTEVYGANCLLEFQTSFFNCIKREVFSSGSPVTEETSLSALTSIVCTLSVQNDQGSPVKGFLAEIMQICQQHLTEKDLRFMVATCRLLQSAAAGSDMSCQFILDKMLPLLTDLYNSQTVKQNNQRKSVLDMLINFLKIALKFDSTSVLTSSSGIDQSVTIVMSAITDSSRQLRQSAIQGLSVLLSFKDVLTPEMKLTAVTTLLNVAFTDNDISEECSAVFTVLANTDIEILKSSVLPVFIKALRRSMTEPMEVDGVNYNHSALFKYLTCVTLSTNVLKIVITELLIAISDITKGLRKGNSADFIQIVTCVSTIFKSSVTDPSSLEYLYEDVVPGIYSILVYMVTNGDSLDNFEHSHNILESLSACIRYTTTTIGHGQLKEFCDKIASLYLCEDCRSFIPFPDQLPVKFQPLQVTSPWQQTQMVSLLTPVICSCPSQVAVSRVNKYIEKLSDLSTLSTHTYTQLSACKCLGGLVNKCPLDENLSRFLQSCQDKLNSVMKSDDTNKYNHVIQWIWLTKALVLRGHPKAKIYISQLLDLLESEEVGEQAAHGFNIILTEQDDVMNKTMNANIRIMYKQRLFQENVTRLSSGFQSSNSGTKKNYLIVLSYMLKVLPKQVMLSELPPLFPLLVHSLLCEDTNLQISTMATLYDLTQEAPDIISKHTDSVIPQLLKLCKNPKSMKIRINALRCIGVLTLLPGHLIIPYKNEVIRELEGILDDKKRLVRKEAVTARGEWFLLEHVNQ